MDGILCFLDEDGLVQAGRQTIDEIDIAGELLVFFLGNTARHEDSQMADVIVNGIDNGLAGCDDIRIVLVQVKNPAEGLLRRSDIVALGAQTDDG